MTVFSRRSVLTAAAATTAVAAVSSVDATLPAVAADAVAPMTSFIGLSAALTGISDRKLSPGRDPLNVKQAYFDRANKYPEFERLLKLYEANKDKPNKDEIAKIILDQPDVRFLARSIILAWYLGAWYEPEVLKKPTAPPIRFEVISSAAYTSGFVWRVAQTHPMGYSEWAFGYWSDPPTQSLDEFIK
jgi:Membrane bound FAD containing D-sorbitol dehydrogenase